MFSPLGGAQVLHPMQLGGLGIAIRDLIVWISEKASPATQGLARWCAIPLLHGGQSRLRRATKLKARRHFVNWQVIWRNIALIDPRAGSLAEDLHSHPQRFRSSPTNPFP
jgi:predicted metalloendopeptidase